MNLEQLSITETLQLYREKKAKPSEVTAAYLKKAEKNPLNAWLTVCGRQALMTAKAQDEILEKEGAKALDRFPLFGIPLGVKDVLVTEGVKTTAGSKMLENYIPPYTSTAVTRLTDAGAIVLGKLNMDEFAMGSSNENSAYGPVKHPTHADRVPGGSSGGSGASVRAFECAAALGTDTGGSIRLPASYCGVVGFKPTYGRISRFGQIAFASSLDQIGPMTRSVEDAARLYEVMAGKDPMDATSSQRAVEKCAASLATGAIDWSKLRIGVPKEYFIDGIDAEVRASVEAALKFYESKGAKRVEISLPHTQYAIPTYYVVAVSEASSNLSRYDGIKFGVRPPEAANAKNLTEFYKIVRTNFGPEVKRRIILGTYALSTGYYDAYYNRACQVRRKMKEDFDHAFKSVDVILSPVAPTTAFKLGAVSDPIQMYLNDILTIPASLAGLPAISLPCGKDKAGLPIGMQLIAPSFEEKRLFQLGHSLEKEFYHES